MPSTPPIERTCALIKPDAVRRGRVVDILLRIQRTGRFDIRRMRVVWPDEDRAKLESHYSCHLGKSFYPELIEFMLSGYSIVLQLEGPGAIKAWRELMGPYAEPRPAGTIRGDFMEASDAESRNLVHGSDSPEEAERELGIWFPAGDEWYCPGD